ncbi:hypothetical protein MRX96_029928 [Rhipicephalus microplus]
MATGAARYWSHSRRDAAAALRLATAAVLHDEILSFSECALKESLMAVPFSADGKEKACAVLFNALAPP